jgi:acyl-CoA thioesterase
MSNAMASQDRLIERMPHDPFSESLGIRYEVTGEGRVTSRVRLSPAHDNALGAVHGALLYTMADTGMGRALATVLPGDARCATLSASIQYLEAARGDVLTAESSVVHVGDKIAATRCEIRGDDGTPCAVATATFYVSRPRENA